MNSKQLFELIEQIQAISKEAGDVDTVKDALACLEAIGFCCTAGVTQIAKKFPDEATDYYRERTEIPLLFSCNPVFQASTYAWGKQLQLGEGLAIKYPQKITGHKVHRAIEQMKAQFDILRMNGEISPSVLNLRSVGDDGFSVDEDIKALPGLSESSKGQWVSAFVDYLMLYRHMTKIELMENRRFTSSLWVLISASKSICDNRLKEQHAIKEAAFFKKYPNGADYDDFIQASYYQIDKEKLERLNLIVECRKYAFRKYISQRLDAWQWVN